MAWACVGLGMTEFNLPMALFLSAGAVALFSFIGVTTWSDNRRREREAFYKSETMKRIVEADPSLAVGMLRDERRRQLEGLKLGGLVTLAVGIAVVIFLKAVGPEAPAFLIGLIPAFIGIALLVYVYLLAPKE
jgi:hypothetical protein